MSGRNGSKARFNIAQKKKIVQRKQTRELQKKLAAAKTEATAATNE
jgi:hypothetical protein